MLLKGKRIFMIEDKYLYVAVASIYLRYEGAIVESQSQVKDLPLVLANHLPIDVILLDLALSRKTSGFDVFDEIRRVPKLAQIPVIAVSAVDPDFALPAARQKGFAGFISKPLSSTIAGHVASVLAGEQVWATESWRPWIQEWFDPSGKMSSTNKLSISSQEGTT